MRILSGKSVAEEMLARLKEEILLAGIHPGLAVVLVGDDPASQLYVRLKEEAAQRVGIRFQKHVFKVASDEQSIIDQIVALNQDVLIHGIIVQLPLPDNLNEDMIVGTIAPEKDADGFHPTTLQRFLSGDERACPVFPGAILRLIRSAKEPLEGKLAVAIVNSKLFGRVMERVFSNLGMHSKIIGFEDIKFHKDWLKKAKVLVSAIGKPRAVSLDDLALDAIVIDGGITRKDGLVLGDVDTEIQESSDARFATPVPGGVGPVTVATLLERVVELARSPQQKMTGV